MVKCTKCNDTGVWETGNNDLPCDACHRGATALFNSAGYGQLTGLEVINTYNKGYRQIPDAWKPKRKKIRKDDDEEEYRKLDFKK